MAQKAPFGNRKQIFMTIYRKISCHVSQFILLIFFSILSQFEYLFKWNDKKSLEKMVSISIYLAVKWNKKPLKNLSLIIYRLITLRDIYLYHWFVLIVWIWTNIHKFISFSNITSLWKYSDWWNHANTKKTDKTWFTDSTFVSLHY